MTMWKAKSSRLSYSLVESFPLHLHISSVLGLIRYPYELRMITNNCCLFRLFSRSTMINWPKIKIQHWTVEWKFKKLHIKDLSDCAVTIDAKILNPIRTGRGCFLHPLRFLEHNSDDDKSFFLKPCDSPKNI